MKGATFSVSAGKSVCLDCKMKRNATEQKRRKKVERKRCEKEEKETERKRYEEEVRHRKETEQKRQEGEQRREKYYEVIKLIKSQNTEHSDEIRKMLQQFEVQKEQFPEDEVFLIHCAFIVFSYDISELHQCTEYVASALSLPKDGEYFALRSKLIAKVVGIVERASCSMLTNVESGKKNIDKVRDLILTIHYVGQRDDCLRSKLSYLCMSVENLALYQWDDARAAKDVGALKEALGNLSFALKIARRKQSNRKYDYDRMCDYLRNWKLD